MDQGYVGSYILQNRLEKFALVFAPDQVSDGTQFVFFFGQFGAKIRVSQELGAEQSWVRKTVLVGLLSADRNGSKRGLEVKRKCVFHKILFGETATVDERSFSIYLLFVLEIKTF